MIRFAEEFAMSRFNPSRQAIASPIAADSQ
jgi:hypothetical protein